MMGVQRRFYTKKAILITRIFIVFLALLALIFSIISSDHLVLLARTSFAGTAMMGPMILVGILSSKKLSLLMPIATIIALFTYILSRIGLFSTDNWILEIELILFLGLALASFVEVVVFRKSNRTNLINN